MNCSKVLKVVGVVAVAVVFCVGCVEKPDDGGGSHANNNNPVTPPDNPNVPNNPNNGGGGKGSNISSYRTVVIGTQKWMAENLDNNVTGSVCYENSADSCSKYGRLYTWEAAKTACPSGWHLPDTTEWNTLVDYAGGYSTAGTKLKSSTGWQSYSGVPAGTDQYGFSALPGGFGYSGGYFGIAGYDGYWWSSTENDAYYAWIRYMGCSHELVDRFYDGKDDLFSVRCVQD